MRSSCESCSTVLLTRLAKQFYRAANDEDGGLPLRMLVALSYVSDHDGAQQQALADAFCMDANNVVLLLNELEERELVARRRDPQDRRRHLVDLTAAGRRELAKAEREQLAIESELLQALAPDEREQLRSLLNRALQGAEPDRGNGDCAAAAAVAASAA